MGILYNAECEHQYPMMFFIELIVKKSQVYVYIYNSKFLPAWVLSYADKNFELQINFGIN